MIVALIPIKMITMSHIIVGYIIKLSYIIIVIIIISMGNPMNIINHLQGILMLIPLIIITILIMIKCLMSMNMFFMINLMMIMHLIVLPFPIKNHLVMMTQTILYINFMNFKDS